jgi:hypothetical protein
MLSVQHNSVRAGRGDVSPRELFGRTSFWSATAGFRMYLGGGPMRMGAYGVLDPMTTMHQGVTHAGMRDGSTPAGHTGH